MRLSGKLAWMVGVVWLGWDLDEIFRFLVGG